MNRAINYIATGLVIGLLADIPLYFIFSRYAAGALSGDEPTGQLWAILAFFGLWIAPPLGAIIGYALSRRRRRE